MGATNKIHLSGWLPSHFKPFRVLRPRLLQAPAPLCAKKPRYKPLVRKASNTHGQPREKAVPHATRGCEHHAGPQGMSIRAAAPHLQDAACCTLCCSAASHPHSTLSTTSQTQQGILTLAGDSRSRFRGRTGSTARPCAGVQSRSTATATWRPAQRDHLACCRQGGATDLCPFLEGASRCTGSMGHATASRPALCSRQLKRL